MRENYCFNFVWANVMVGSVYQAATENIPELVHAWPTRSGGGHKIDAFKLTEAFALMAITPTGGQFPQMNGNLPADTLPVGCPIEDPLDIFCVTEWARDALNIDQRSSVFVVPMMEAPTNEQEFKALPAEIQSAINAQINIEFQRIHNLLLRFQTSIIPPKKAEKDKVRLKKSEEKSALIHVQLELTQSENE